MKRNNRKPKELPILYTSTWKGNNKLVRLLLIHGNKNILVFTKIGLFPKITHHDILITEDNIIKSKRSTIGPITVRKYMNTVYLIVIGLNITQST